jgi:hypothetical protein
MFITGREHQRPPRLDLQHQDPQHCFVLLFIHFKPDLPKAYVGLLLPQDCGGVILINQSGRLFPLTLHLQVTIFYHTRAIVRAVLSKCRQGNRATRQRICKPCTYPSVHAFVHMLARTCIGMLFPSVVDRAFCGKHCAGVEYHVDKLTTATTDRSNLNATPWQRKGYNKRIFKQQVYFGSHHVQLPSLFPLAPRQCPPTPFTLYLTTIHGHVCT